MGHGRSQPALYLYRAISRALAPIKGPRNSQPNSKQPRPERGASSKLPEWPCWVLFVGGLDAEWRFDSFPWIHRKLVCESDTELKTLPSERI